MRAESRIGPLGADQPNIYVAAGFCGHGMPQCFGAGKAVALMLTGREAEVHPYVREATNPSRFLAPEV